MVKTRNLYKKVRSASDKGEEQSSSSERDLDEGDGEVSQLFGCSTSPEPEELDCKITRLRNESAERLEEILRPKNFPDLFLYCGKSLKKCEAHRAVFSVCSDFFKMVLAEEEPFRHSYILLPDYEYDDVMNLLSFIYTGEIELSDTEGETLEQMLEHFGVREESVLYYVSKSTKALTNNGFVDDPEGVALLDSGPEEQDDRPIASRLRKTRSTWRNGGWLGARDGDEAEPENKQTASRKRKFIQTKATKKKGKTERDSSDDGLGRADEAMSDDPLSLRDDDPLSLRDDDSQDVLGTSGRSRTATCPECNLILSLGAMSEHLRHEHSIKKAYFCDSCNHVFYVSTARKEHEKCHPELMMRCEPCGKQMTKRQLKQHKQLHARREKTYQCEICKLTVPLYKKFQHSLVHTPNNCLSCEQCGKKYFSVGSLSRHMLCHSGQEHHICYHCKRIFPSLEAKLEHAKSHTRTKMGCKCQVCGEMLSHTHFIPHLRKHGYQEMEFAGNDKTCPRCPRTFKSVDLTVNHLVGHLDSPRPHECDVCFLPMRTIGLLESHKQRVHTTAISTEEQEELSPVIPCPFCKNVYDWRSGVLRRHIMDHAWDILDCDQTDKDVSCIECGRIFPYARYAVNHFVSHVETSRKPEFECRKCYLMEKTHASYSSHIRRCKGEKGRVNARNRQKTPTTGLDEEEEEADFVSKLSKSENGDIFGDRWVEEDDDVSYICETCNTSFDNEDDYSIHKQFCD